MTFASTTTTEPLYFEDVAVGDEVTPLVTMADETQLFFFGAATYNGHRIHYDKAWACDREGYDDVLVQGPLQSALLARSVADWIGPTGRLVAFSAQNRAVAFPGQELTFGGRVTGTRVEDGRRLVDLELAGRRGPDVLMPGSATVELPLRGEAAS